MARFAKLFTPEEANAMLPLVRAIVTDVVNLSRDLQDRRERLSDLSADQLSTDDPYDEELVQMAEDFQRDTERLEGYLKELEDLGIACKGTTEGLIDFPSRVDGRTVFLCWKHGEPEVAHWHELDSGYSGRRPLTAGALSDSSGQLGRQLPGRPNDSLFD